MANTEKRTTKLPEFAAIWARASKHPEIVDAEDFGATIRYESEEGEPPLESLPLVPLQRVGNRPSLLEMANLKLGKGGIGEVHLATQPALRRDVAVKTAHGSSTETMQERMLLREALVMGYLEHPNIVPVHIVGRNEEGELVVAMKRIEGITFADRLTEPEHAAPFDENVRVLIGVCHALQFAHEHGIVHLDIKPANIMIGRYNDVYLVDWGTAVAFRDDVPSTIPRPLDDGRVRGTPAFMAPEQMANRPPTPQTDIYLMGGMLYSLLTGLPPNRGSSMKEVFDYCYNSPDRAFPEDAPPDLVEVAKRALKSMPYQRYDSIVEFRQALERYSANAAARNVYGSALKQAGAFREAVSKSAPEPAVYAAFGAARQSFKDAGRLNPESVTVTADERELLLEMIEWEMERGNPSNALALVHELPTPDEELEVRVTRALEARTKELVELEKLRYEFDPNVSAAARAALWVGIATAIGVIHLVPWLAGVTTTPVQVFLGHVGYLTVLAILSAVFNERLFATLVNRQVVYLVWLMSLFGLALRGMSWAGFLDLGHAMALDLSLVALVSTFGAMTIDRRAWVAAPFYFAAALAAALRPELGSVCFGLGHFFALTAFALILYRATPASD